jgi:hypothetical protein
MKLLRPKDYVPGEDSRAFHRCRAKNLIAIASIRSSKTYSLRREVVASAWNNQTPFGLLCMGPTFGQTYETLELPVYELAREWRLAGRGSLNKNEHKLTLNNGTPIYFRSAESADTGIRGLDIFKVAIDELTLCSRDAFDVALGRLLLTNGEMRAVGTPKGMSNWVFQTFFGPEKNVPPDTEFMKFRITNNPLITPEAIARLRATLDPLMARQEIDGDWVPLSDKVIYYAFERSRVVREVPKPPKGEPVYVFLDYNVGINAWCAAWKDFRTNRIYVFAEGYGDKTTAEAGRRILNQFGDRVIVIDDATGRNRQQGDAKTQREILQQVGIHSISTASSNPPVDKRQAVVNAHFLNGLGETHLFISPDCRKLIHECETLSRKPNSLDVDTQGGKAGHITDALGYGVYYLSGGSAAWGVPPEPVTVAA